MTNMTLPFLNLKLNGVRDKKKNKKQNKVFPWLYTATELVGTGTLAVHDTSTRDFAIKPSK